MLSSSILAKIFCQASFIQGLKAKLVAMRWIAEMSAGARPASL